MSTNRLDTQYEGAESVPLVCLLQLVKVHNA